MPVYRPDPRHLDAAVESVIAQTFADWELVIVEDPSDRPGTSVIEKRADRRIRYLLNERRTGLSRQHNRAVAEAKGDLIARFDADDVCEPDRLARQVELLDCNPDIDVVSSQLRIIDGSGQEIGVRHYPLDHEEIVRAMHRYNPISGSNAMFRRHVVTAVGGWREGVERPAQDYEWYSRVAVHGFRFATHPGYLVRYRLHPGQIKQTKLRGTLLTTLEVKRRYWLRSMGPRSILQLIGECVLLVVPPAIVLWVFRRISYR